MKLFYFVRLMMILFSKFFLAQDYKDHFPVIELGPFKGNGETYSIVLLLKGFHPQHIHDESDARLHFHSGEGVLILGHDKKEVPYQAGDVFEIPKGTPHGFRAKKVGVFLAWQSQPITNLETDKRDVRYAD